MNTYEIETEPLPESLTICLSKTFSSFRLIANTFFFAFGWFIVIMISSSIENKMPLRDTFICLAGLVIGLILIFIGGLQFLQFIKNARHAYAKTPIIEMSPRVLKIGTSQICWNDIVEYQFYDATRSSKSTRTYVIFALSDENQISANDLTDAVTPWIYRAVRRRILKEFNLNAKNTLVMPLYGFDLEQGYLSIFIKRYWCDATGRTYRPTSSEALYPQKKASDFIQRQ